ncbi:T9SS type A sorting domain-containing protein [Poritiphilus flavus]|uniref:T9SS type A sorting domain-containing protein n=1 Tax=Poritiphilus flavus TaxID=2697053 RepID=A0A6L9EFQ4_9FLAO|nr:T9SS type A sorting domain-containing protein [Poritiphilus flavus]NAS13574.1 T9SS type A sorting domain-containing protein [Poritiphilus flavus]
MKSSALLCLFSLLFSQILSSQVESNFYPEGNARATIASMTADFKAQNKRDMPSFDVQAMLREDEQRAKSETPRPYRFGKGFDTNINVSLAKDGEETQEGRSWSMEFYSRGAISINFVLERLNLAKGAELYLINESETMTYGPLTSMNNKIDGVFLTDLIFGERVTMYVTEPLDVKESSSFTIKRVVHAYRGLSAGEMTGGTPGASEACNNDLACFAAWMQPGRSEALILLSNGNEHCSGCLLTTTDNAFRPFFLTAFHCADSNQNDVLSAGERNNAEDWMYKFGFRQVSCTSTNFHYNWTTTNGATFRAGWGNTDFLLMELQSTSVVSYSGNVTFAGWDRRANTPTSGASIHHPAGDMTKISIENNAFQTSNWGGVNNHWLVNFDDGVVQHGSSGSPIFNQNQRVVGQLHGNQNYNPFNTYCNQPRGEYGRFNLSWTGGGTNDTRLSNWLDPCGTGAQTTNTILAPYLNSYSSIGCTAKSYTVYNLPAGSTISWSNSSNLTRVSSQGSNPASFKANGTGSAWVRATVTPPNGCGNSYVINSNTTAAGGTTITISISGPDYHGWIIAQASGGSGTHTWTLNGSTTWTSTSTTTSRYVGCYGGYLTVQAAGNCGPGSGGTGIPSGCSGGGFYFSVYPNPSNDEINIAQVHQQKNSSSTPILSLSNALTLSVYNMSGQLLKSVRKDGGRETFSMNVADLKKGNYILKITGKGIDETHQVIVE